MAKLESAFFDLSRLETLSRQETSVHRLDPRAKLLTTAVFLVTVMSFGRDDLSAIAPFFLYPMVMMGAGNLPMGYLLKRILVVLPFVALVGIFNPLLDRAIVMKLGPLGISGGWVSFLSILARCVLAVWVAMILVATTGFHAMCAGLERMGVPNVFVTVLLFVHRYLFVLIDEASRMARARSLRSFSRRGFGLKAWSSLGGHLLLRTMDRAQRVHRAMLSRGFSGEVRVARRDAIRPGDVAFVLVWSGLFVVMRVYNVSTLAGNALMKALS
jgi:cobalt/nickel transport system permease protein